MLEQELTLNWHISKKVKSKASAKKEDKYNPKSKAKKGRTARGKYTLPKKGFMR